MAVEGDREFRMAERYFLDALRRLVEDGDLSQQGIADKMVERGHRFHQSTIYKILRGDRKVTLGEAIDLADVLGVPLSEMTVPKHEEYIQAAFRRALTYMEGVRDNTSRLLRQQRTIQEFYILRDDWATETRKTAEAWADPDLAERAFRAGMEAGQPHPDDPPMLTEADLLRMFSSAELEEESDG